MTEKESEKSPKEEKKSSWAKLKPKEVESIVIALAKEGKSASEIGIILRDQHGVPKAKDITSKKISKILEEAKVEFPTEKKIVESRISSLQLHLGKNKKDYTAKRALTKKLWAVQKY